MKKRCLLYSKLSYEVCTCASVFVCVCVCVCASDTVWAIETIDQINEQVLYRPSLYLFHFLECTASMVSSFLGSESPLRPNWLPGWIQQMKSMSGLLVTLSSWFGYLLWTHWRREVNFFFDFPPAGILKSKPKRRILLAGKMKIPVIYGKENIYTKLKDDDNCYFE